MRKFTLFFMVVALFFSGVTTFAQSVLIVEPGVGTLNAAIKANGGNKIYQLKAGQWYQLDAIIENVDYHLQIIGEVPAAGKIPATLQTNADAGGAVFNKMFDAKGNITLKNVYFVNADLTGVVGNEFLHQSKEDGRTIVDKCIIDPVSNGNGLVMNSGNTKTYFTNNLCLRMGHQLNPNDGHFFVTDNNSGKGVDTLHVENNTFVAMGTTMHAGGFTKFVHNYINWNHNTWVLQKSQIDWTNWENEMYFTNNLMFDFQTQPWAANWQPMPGGDAPQPKPALIYSDTIPGETLPSKTIQYWEYNMHYRNPKFYTMLNELNAMAIKDSKPIMNLQPLLWPNDSINAKLPNNVPRETILFKDDKTFPNWKYGNHLTDIDPKFVEAKIYQRSDSFVVWTKPASMVHAMGYPADQVPPASKWAKWHWDLDGDPSINTAWPVFNGVYTNPALLKASIENLPLGDLNWFPEAKAKWEAEKDKIFAHIKSGNEGKYVFTGIQSKIEGVDFTADCYPNPFTNETTISFTLKGNTGVEISIVNMMGQEVMSLVNEVKPAGSHTIKWNGKDNNGNRIQTGMYLYKIKTDTGSKAGRIIFSK